MGFLYFVIMALIASFASLTLYEQSSIDLPVASQVAQSQLNQYQVFLYVSAQYMSTYRGGSGKIYWSTLKTVPGAPSGAVTMPGNWYVYTSGNGTWYACTQMLEQAAGALGQFTAPAGIHPVPTTINGNEYLVIDSPSNVAETSQCAN